MANIKPKNGSYKAIVSWHSDKFSFEPITIGNVKAIEISSLTEGQSVTVFADELQHLIKVAKAVKKLSDENEVQEVKEVVSKVKEEAKEALKKADAVKEAAESKTTES